jgi:hypothetical protein
MRLMNAYKDMLDNVVNLITCVSMHHQNQLEQMVNGLHSLPHLRPETAAITEPLL